jgi:hypothetical protein
LKKKNAKDIWYALEFARLVEQSEWVWKSTKEELEIINVGTG